VAFKSKNNTIYRLKKFKSNLSDLNRI
jgi:hypothetical protein